jgi:methionyl-tRNA formyltransferase
MRFFAPGQFKRLLILGSGSVGLATARFARERNLVVEVFLGERQADDRTTDGVRVVDGYGELGIEVRVENNIRACPGGPYETADEGTLIFSFGSPYIIQQDLISLYGGRVVNSHGAPLPEWRGGGGFSWRILAGDRRGNTCFHQITPGIDDGVILFQRSYLFPIEARFPGDWQAIADGEASAAAVELLNQIHSGQPLSPIMQDEGKATYFPRLHTPSQAYIDWNWRGVEIERFVLAFSHPYEGAKTQLGGQTMHIMDCRPTPPLPHSHPFLHGLVLRVHEGMAHVVVNDGILEIPLEAVRCDTPLRDGDRLHTPVGFLDAAQQVRPVYTAAGLKGARSE